MCLIYFKYRSTEEVGVFKIAIAIAIAAHKNPVAVCVYIKEIYLW